MVNLQQYEAYWAGIQQRMPAIASVQMVTLDAEMGKQIQGLAKDQLPALFVIIPNSQGKSRDVDNIREQNLCVVFVMDKSDPQRRKAYQVQKELQPVIEELKTLMIDDKATGCLMLQDLDLTSLSTIPESGLYSVFAGWSLGFNFDTE